MFKKPIAFVLSLLFMFSAFAVSTVFEGVITAEAVYYDYYAYHSLPGFGAFTAEDLKEIHTPGLSGEQASAPASAPDRIDSVTKFTVTSTTTGEYQGNVGLTSYTVLNLGEINTSGEPINEQWVAKKYPSSGATITGDIDLTEYSGICFWVGKNDSNYDNSITVNLFAVPSQGPTGYYTGTDEVMIYSTLGFCFETRTSPDEDGYVYLDFKNDFYQVDWWWKHDDGKNYTCLDGDFSTRPLPMNALELISGISISLRTDTVGDVFYIGDFCAYRDSRIHTDELANAIDIFDALNPESYTEESYTAATEIYLKAYDMLLDPYIKENYSQNQVDKAARDLLAAIDALLPMFPAKDSSIQLGGFDSLTEEDLELINDGGVSIDLAAIAVEGIGPLTADQTLEIIANGDPSYNEPYYGWSCFTTAANSDDGMQAIGNIFGADLSETAGIRFWLKNPVDVAPLSMQIAVGKAGEVEFVVEDYDIVRPLTEGEEGYVHASWSVFYDAEGEADIYDYLDQLDYISIRFDDLRNTVYYISDLHAYNWSIHNADLTELKNEIVATYAYIATLNKAEFGPRSWSRLLIAISDAEALIESYGVTQDQADSAQNLIINRRNELVPIWDNATEEALNYLTALYKSAKTYWRGNYTGLSYVSMKNVVEEAGEALETDVSATKCAELTEKLETAITALVPIQHSGIVDTIKSLENLTSRQFSRATGHRRDNVEYELTTSSDSLTLPFKALKMTALTDLSSKVTDEHGALQFKLFDDNGNTIEPDITLDGNRYGATIGNLMGTSGIRLWVGVNDPELAKDAYFRFGVSNCTESPIFERHAVEIPFPTTGSGWIYIPWEYFEYYDEWTNGEQLNLGEIRFYIIRVDGYIPEGLEVYTPGIDAYTEPVASTNSVPVIKGVSDGETVDVSVNPLSVSWDVGAAIMNGKYYSINTPITVNGNYTITVTNGDKATTVNFTVTGGMDPDATPIVTGVENGGEYESATITWSVGTATLDDVAFENGSTVTTPGTHALVVTNGSKQVKITFTIVSSEPERDKGDFDGDGEITVADALAALRIAARMTTGTAEDLAIGDIDADGEITVADALAILRVAARMSDSL